MKEKEEPGTSGGKPPADAAPYKIVQRQTKVERATSLCAILDLPRETKAGRTKQSPAGSPINAHGCGATRSGGRERRKFAHLRRLRKLLPPRGAGGWSCSRVGDVRFRAAWRQMGVPSSPTAQTGRERHHIQVGSAYKCHVLTLFCTYLSFKVQRGNSEHLRGFILLQDSGRFEGGSWEGLCFVTDTGAFG